MKNRQINSKIKAFGLYKNLCFIQKHETYLNIN